MSLRKVSEAAGPVLNWMVARCEGWDSYDIHSNGAFELERTDTSECLWLRCFTPSADWSQGGPIIEREKIDIEHDFCSHEVVARKYLTDEYAEQWGPTPPIAAMRCFVASKLGDEVEVPEELMS